MFIFYLFIYLKQFIDWTLPPSSGGKVLSIELVLKERLTLSVCHSSGFSPKDRDRSRVLSLNCFE
jgi:hypothetical protein